MDIGVERPTEALDRGDRTPAGVSQAPPGRTLSLPAPNTVRRNTARTARVRAASKAS
jgi:hypothetical protein